MKLSEEELEKVIAGCIEGNRKYQQKVYEAFYGKMMSICLRYTKDADVAKDVLQDGFIKVFSKMEHFNMEGSFEGWVRRIIVNTAIDYFRKNRSAPILIEDEGNIEDLDHAEEEESESIYQTVKFDTIIEAMNKLSPAYKTVFNLYVMENYTHKEIAEILDISIGTSKSNLAKAKLNLKKILEKELVKLKSNG
jgi:RNA polymerase sigma-70 factor (ECF subfamily)